MGSVFGCACWFIDTNNPWVPHCKFQQPDYYDFSAVTFSNYTHTGKALVGISPIGVNVQWIYPRSISDSNITEKNLMWLAGFRKNMSEKGFFKHFMSGK